MSTESKTEYVVGQRVVAARTIDKGPDDESPGQTFCLKGEELIVRSLNDSTHWPIYVSHEHRTDLSFGVEPRDILPFNDQELAILDAQAALIAEALRLIGKQSAAVPD